ncbi:putative tubulin tyrosine ligase [Leptomonas pyrrhocoris]|uniref:Putative tubulin tyrosine ligase n=1 Tax=Leptomonas pyrrhocoris TaxID=157538 RepID=A0A0M9GAZ2_LEPPY|nr:putative tubulin tyrosine ligase [Leptomonas pyrrhocoris]XP_015665059.1 putative tubulin tyrosine ligase [Leptomonas pyrrhocoris]KPA86619.1 putative tubulin tyrosine ligase [Leptomonas pyrrhocoris]KPA86620.1 putative tubulin tyrosine ligase [Leptomonas pyrrhocoris]|eukprot:XP_015665058.1 putative tubulin tyrosine ligase [Leptomonas pyrrhocoris]
MSASSSRSSLSPSSSNTPVLPPIVPSQNAVVSSRVAPRMMRQQRALPSVGRELSAPCASNMPTFYPQSLWWDAQQGKEDLDKIVRKRTYRSSDYPPMTIGKYVSDPTGRDFSDPRYVPNETSAPGTARSRSSSRPARRADGTAAGPASRTSSVAATNYSTCTTTTTTTATSTTKNSDEEEDDLALRVAAKRKAYTVVVPLYPSSAASFYFPPSYAQSSRDMSDRRGPPRKINEDLHPNDRADMPLSFVQVRENNMNRMGLYKIGPGAVAFNAVMKAFEAAGLKYTDSNKDFNVLWAKRATVYTLSSINAYQKVNHFPGTWGVGRKDRLAANVRRMQRYFGRDVFDIVPTTFLIPQDEADLRRDAEQDPGTPEKPLIYIVKPGASSCGRGIHLFQGIPPMPRGGGREKEMVCQRYIGNPLLIYGRKFDLRLYCVVTSFDPLRIYLFDEGLVRFAAEKYRGPDQDIENIHVHLTNYSVNKTAELSRESNGKDYESDDPLDIKWCISDFKRHLETHHPLGRSAWDRIQAECEDVVIKTFLSIEHSVIEEVGRNCADRSGRNCFELFGLDLMADDDLHVRLLEVNIMPSLATGSSLDKAVKSRMLAHMLTLVRVIPYRRDSQLDADNSEGVYVPRGIQRQTGERSYKFGKHPFPSSRIVEQPLLAAFNDPSVEDSYLSKAETLMLREYEEELHCSGGFRCVYPAGETVERYLPLFLHGVRRSNYVLASAAVMKSQNPGKRLFES